MEIIENPLQDCYVIKAPKFGDQRGFFMESMHKQKLKDLGIELEVYQNNFAKSQKGVLRGLHYQLNPFAQAKLVCAISGGVIDYLVDLRKSSTTYLNSCCIELLSPETMLYVPRGFAHGYQSLKDDTIFHYAVDNYYSNEHERSINAFDPVFDFQLDRDNLMLSQKDKDAPLLSDAEMNFA